MYEDQTDRSRNENTRRDMMRQMIQDRQSREMMARKLRDEAMKQGLAAIEGIFAVPAVVALGAASWAMFAVSFLERGFEAFQRTQDQMERGRDDRQERLDWEGADRQERPEPGQPRA
jgi:hypothetical protein